MSHMSHHPSNAPDHRNDLDLVQKILAGDEEAWQLFMVRYAGLITSVAGRYLFDADEVAAVQAEVFKILFEGKLVGYRGRSSLAAWVAVVTRNITADFLREKFGRREVPSGLKKMSSLHRDVFHLFFVEGFSFPATLRKLRRSRPDLDRDTLLVTMQDIHDTVTDKTLRRIAYDLAAPSVGAASGRLLEYCRNLAWDEEGGPRDPDPLTRLMLKEAETRARRIIAMVDELPEEDRRIIALRFDKGLRAKEIAHRLELPNQRKAYTVIDRVLKKLRNLLDQEGDGVL